MATTGIRLRLLSVDAAVLVDDLFGDQALATTERFGEILELQGQPRFFQQEQMRATYGGDAHPSMGYVTFSRATLVRVGLQPHTLQKSLIVGINTPQGWQDTNLIVQEVRDRGHLAGGSLIVKVYFKKYGDEEGSN